MRSFASSHGMSKATRNRPSKRLSTRVYTLSRAHSRARWRSRGDIVVVSAAARAAAVSVTAACTAPPPTCTDTVAGASTTVVLSPAFTVSPRARASRVAGMARSGNAPFTSW